MLLVLMLDLCISKWKIQSSLLPIINTYRFNSFPDTIQGVASGLWLVYELLIPVLVWTMASWNSWTWLPHFLLEEISWFHRTDFPSRKKVVERNFHCRDMYPPLSTYYFHISCKIREMFRCCIQHTLYWRSLDKTQTFLWRGKEENLFVSPSVFRVSWSCQQLTR